ncbi:MAG TPA: acyl-CoA dehydrogenase family protein [Angustibacter sp.]|nr:acyl-CoA dehydrogenase family protein [Angustibacter sp.]
MTATTQEPGAAAQPPADEDGRPAADLVERVRVVAEDVARPAADDVDDKARFPQEAIDALRSAGALGALVPRADGPAHPLSEVARAAEALGRTCASTAMIFAMHHIQVACLVRHGRNPALRELTARVGAEQLLLASATTEAGIGGDVRTSSCHVRREGTGFSLTKNAPVISYGAYADGVLATARRTEDSPPNDQVLVACLPPGLSLEQTSEWNTLGFRGTCSPGFVLTAEGPQEWVLDDAYGDISAQTMLPTSHLLWASVWLGIATEAYDRARRFVRAAARAKPGVHNPAAVRLAELATVHQQMTDLVHGAARLLDETADDPERRTSLAFAISMNNLKISSSTLVVEIVHRATLICGIVGYREDTPYRMGRLLRDAYGAALMVNNDRIITNNAQLLLVAKD